MKTLIRILLLAALVAGLATLAIAASDTATSTVSIAFSEIAELAVSGNPSPLTIATTTAGSLPDDQSDATTKMLWTSNVASGTRKITGKIASLFDGIDLYATVVAANSCGTTAGEQKLIVTDTDFVTGIGNCITDIPGGTITFRADVTSMVAPYTSTQKVVTWTLTAAS